MSQASMGFYRIKGLAIVMVSAIALDANSSVAQITPDTTLPVDFKVDKVNQTFNIDGGKKAGNNLFHSFKEFSVPTGWEAVFKNGADIQNIFTRVTGKSISNIDGLIKANGSANLFLMNPNGILFGENARLDIGGSFIGTTAESMKFPDSSEFSAVNPQAPPLLKINVPLGLQFGKSPGNIKVGNNLQTSLTDKSPTLLEVKPGKTLALIGGEVELNGERLRAPGGRIELGGLASAGTVEISHDGSFSFPLGVERADTLLNRGEVDVTGGGGGDISIHARNIKLNLGTDICAGIGGDDACGKLASNTTGAVGSQAGDIMLNATGDITGDKGVKINNRVNRGVIGNSGNIDIKTRSLTMSDGAKISASTFGKGNAGNIIVRAKDIISLTGGDIFSTVGAGGVGKAGNININATSLKLENAAQLLTITREASKTQPAGRGNAGNVDIKVTGAVDIVGIKNNTLPSGIFSRVKTGTNGNGGDITIDAGSFKLRDGAQISTSTSGEGNAGNITVSAKTGSLEVLNGAQVSASTFGKGNAGNIIVLAKDAISLKDSYILSTVGAGGVGKGGNIDIDAASLKLENAAQLLTITREASKTQPAGRGNAGNVDIKVTGAVDIVGMKNNTLPSGIFSRVKTGTNGNGGDITIDAGSFKLRDGAQISTSTSGEGNAGNVTVSAKTGSLEVLNGAQVSASTNGKGNAGSVNINANDLVKIDGQGVFTGAFSQVNKEANGNAGDVSIAANSLEIVNRARLSTSTSGEGNAGDLSIKATESVKVIGTGETNTHPSLSANVSGRASRSDRKGGDLRIDTKKLVITNAQVSASTSGLGNAGNLSVNASESVEISGKIFSTNKKDPTTPINNPAGLFSQVNSEGEGNGGNLSVETPSLSVGNGGKIQVAVFGKGDAGKLSIRASDIDIYDTPGEADFFQGGIFAGFQFDGDESTALPEGDFGGAIAIETDRLRVRDGGTVTVFTEGNGNAGRLQINAKDYIEVYGKVNALTTNNIFTSKISGEATTGSTGNGGSVKLNSDKFIVRDGGKISVDNQGEKVGGDIEIYGGSLTLDNGGKISAETRSNTGGNINLNLQDLLLLRNGSQISTTAGNEQFGGDGGNIKINAPLIVAVPKENSDISANAFMGNGGEVNIKAQGIFGIEFQKRPTSQSDITASSKFGVRGTVNINTPELDPTSGLIELPLDVVDASQQISNACTPRSRQFENRFVVMGRGGLPMSPTEPLQDTNTLSAWVKLKPQSQTAALRKISNLDNNSRKNEITKRNQIIEATGWIVDKNGNIEFVAQANQSNFKSLSQTAACSVSE
ncbi:filamentous hemagglutinin family N-terminal domain protein [Rivularia sp. PCC 7116]|uniref:two-partner secretion domain-containing protein n=1 Tax=Rivularia sp. PCC 7116 TaxID=373994 RepID=UPI00029F3CF4|nr:filamentous hemagglutinin N-terminal domain-containing protein [Rivularia sp. PCC 7116]AFY56423.1 filamentous hemagglutinin family N-terminal domain protein [Rivularia sp. PCC 7116]